MRAQKIPIAGRELKAASLASERLGTALPIAPLPDRKPIEGVYVGEDLSLHIRAWIQAKYGEKLKVNWGPGTVPVLVDGDLYAMSLPLLFGRVRIVAHPATHHKNFDKHAALPTTVCNVLDFIEGLTTVVSASLSQEALTSIMKLFCVALESFAFIGRAPSSEWINARTSRLGVGIAIHTCGPLRTISLGIASSDGKIVQGLYKFYGKTFAEDARSDQIERIVAHLGF